jgi:hypothetical protein
LKSGTFLQAKSMRSKWLRTPENVFLNYGRCLPEKREGPRAYTLQAEGC